jgi:hypothetical protein
MTSIEPTKKKPLSRARRQAIENFIEKSLISFAGRKPRPPIVEQIEGKERTTGWRWFINHFFFVERGSFNGSPEYMSLVSKRGGTEKGLVFANINLPDKWRILSADSPTWGEHLTDDVECSEEAVIRSMIGFLFDRNYIVATSEDENY